VRTLAAEPPAILTGAVLLASSSNGRARHSSTGVTTLILLLVLVLVLTLVLVLVLVLVLLLPLLLGLPWPRIPPSVLLYAVRAIPQ